MNMLIRLFDWLTLPDVQARVDRQLTNTAHQLLDAMANLEAAQAQVDLLERRMRRLEHFKNFQENLHVRTDLES